MSQKDNRTSQQQRGARSRVSDQRKAGLGVVVGIGLLLSIIAIVLASRSSNQQPNASTQVATPLPTAPLVITAAPASPIPMSDQPLPSLVFVRQGNIWRSDGRGEVQQVTDLGLLSYAQFPAVSPSDGRIAFTVTTQPPLTTATTDASTAPPLTYALHVMNADGTEPHVVWQPTQDIVLLSSWAADGRALYVSVAEQQPTVEGQRPTYDFKIVRVDVATGEQQVLLSDVRDPALAPTGSLMAYLAFSKDGLNMSLQVAASDGSNSREVVGGKGFEAFFAPRFSSDGSRIVFAGFGGPEVDEQGHPLTASGQSPLEGILGLFAPAVAEAHGQPWGVWVVNVDGTGLRRLTVLYHGLPMASFSPDGTQVVAMDGSGIFLLETDGNQIQQLDTLGDNGGIVWTRE